MAKKKDDTLGTKLETAVAAMLDQISGKDIDVELKLKVFDRALKYWAVKNKVGDPAIGAAWDDISGDEE